MHIFRVHSVRVLARPNVVSFNCLDNIM